jgi:hypothetical protein
MSWPRVGFGLLTPDQERELIAISERVSFMHYQPTAGDAAGIREAIAESVHPDWQRASRLAFGAATDEDLTEMEFRHAD